MSPPCQIPAGELCPAGAGCSTSTACTSSHKDLHFVLQPQTRAKAAVAPLLMAPSPLQTFRPATAARRGSCEGSLFPKEYEEILQ